MARRKRQIKKADPKKAIAYLRVSKDSQDLGPEAQQEAIDRWCSSNGTVVIATCLDHGVSGGADLEKRLGLLSAIDALREHGAGVLLVAKRDRLARDVVISGMIQRLVEKESARIQSADGTGNGDGPEAQMMRGIIDVFAQYERALIRARTKAALMVKKERNERIGRIPYGSRLAADGLHLESDPEEQKAIAMVQDLRVKGMAQMAIAQHLNKRGIAARGRKGQPSKWSQASICRLLQREAA